MRNTLRCLLALIVALSMVLGSVSLCFAETVEGPVGEIVSEPVGETEDSAETPTEEQVVQAEEAQTVPTEEQTAPAEDQPAPAEEQPAPTEEEQTAPTEEQLETEEQIEQPAPMKMMLAASPLKSGAAPLEQNNSEKLTITTSYAIEEGTIAFTAEDILKWDYQKTGFMKWDRVEVYDYTKVTVTVTPNVTPNEKYRTTEVFYEYEYKVGKYNKTAHITIHDGEFTINAEDHPNIVIGATFERVYEITLESDHGTLVYGRNEGSFEKAKDEKIYLKDFSFQPNPGYEFKEYTITASGESVDILAEEEWKLLPVLHKEEGDKYFLVPEGDVTVEAVCELIEYKIYEKVEGLGSYQDVITVTKEVGGNEVNTATCEDTLYITVNKSVEGYKFDTLSVNRNSSNLSTQDDGSYKYTMTPGDVKFTATYKKIHEINIYDTENGVVTTEAIAPVEGDEITLKITPDASNSYMLDKSTFAVTYLNAYRQLCKCKVDVKDDLLSATFTMPDADVYVSAEFIIEPVLYGEAGDEFEAGDPCQDSKLFYIDSNYEDCKGKILTIYSGETDLIINGNKYSHIKVDKGYKGTLTLRNVVLENYKLCSDPVIDAEAEDGLNLVIEGNVEIEANNALAAIRAEYTRWVGGAILGGYVTTEKNINISGSGILSIDSEDGYGIHCKNLTINNTTVDIMAENHAIWAEGNLTIDGGKVIVGNESRVSVDGCCAAVKVDGEFEIKGSHKAYLYAVNYSSVMPAVHFENVVSNEGIYALGNTFAIPYDYKNGKLRVIHYLKEELPRWNGMHHLAEPCQGDTYYDRWYNASTVYLRPAIANVIGTVTNSVASAEAISSASICLMQGNTVVEEPDTGLEYKIPLEFNDENGGNVEEFKFVDVPDGNYNIVVTVELNDGKIIVVTVGITVPNNDVPYGIVEKDIVVTETNASSELDVKQDSVDNKVDTEKAVVTGLDKVAEEILKKEEGLEGGSVDVKLIVEEKIDFTTSPDAIGDDQEKQKLANEQQSIKQYASGEAKVDFVDMKVEKTVNNTTPEALSELPSVVEIAIPYDMSAPVPEGVEMEPQAFYEQYVNVARNHNGVVQVFTKLDARPADNFQDGTCYVWYNTANPAESCVYIYTNQFSTYAIILGDISIPTYTYYDNSYRIEVKIAQNGRGTVTTSKNWAEYGDKITITVVPQAGYKAEVNVYKAVNNAKVDLTENEDGTYSFNMPGCNAVVSVSFVCTLGGECPMAPYTDLDASKWYHDGIHFCIANKYMVGYEDMTFKPYADVTKAEFLAVLYRYAQAEGKGFQGDWMFLMPYTDLADIPAYANEAFAWMTTKQIIEADADGKINARGPITREEFVDIMYKFAQVLGTDVSIGEETNILSFGDATTICEGKAAGFQWAVGAQIMCGDLNGNLRPHDNASRAEAAVLLEEFYKNVVEKKKEK